MKWEGSDIMSRKSELAEEDRKIRFLKLLVDLSLNLIATGQLSKKEAYMYIDLARKSAINLFPGKGNTFDLIYRPRFLRVIDEVFGKDSCRF